MPDDKRILINASPKVKFLADPQSVGKHRDLISLPQFEKSVNVALLQMQTELCVPKKVESFNEYAAFHLMERGAKYFLSVLRNLSEEAVEPRKTETQELDHRA